tara:strand:- start:254 stop:631 length:378 start_codon:yes stop_codon:yes gene_type:complete
MLKRFVTAIFAFSFTAMVTFSVPAYADPPLVTEVTVSQNGDVYRFDVTISHKDFGWEHYADAWRILDMDGNELGLRDLAHPHDGQQRLTRSLSNIQIPDGVTSVGIQARDSLTGWSPDVKIVKLP